MSELPHSESSRSIKLLRWESNTQPGPCFWSFRYFLHSLLLEYHTCLQPALISSFCENQPSKVFAIPDLMGGLMQQLLRTLWPSRSSRASQLRMFSGCKWQRSIIEPSERARWRGCRVKGAFPATNQPAPAHPRPLASANLGSPIPLH